MKRKAVGTPSGSTPLFQLGVSPSSDSEDSEGTQEVLAALGWLIASQAKRDLLCIGAQLPLAYENLQSPSSGCQHTPPKGPCSTMRYAFKSLRTASGNIECTGLVKNTKLANVDRQPAKKPPKYSKNLEVVNTSSLTDSDEKYLEKKALAWGLRYK
jgi:hypothetical protein